MRAAPVPNGIISLFHILGGSAELTALAAHRLRRNPASVRAIAANYIKRILATGDPDHYRILGVPRDAPQEQIDAHLQAALAWLLNCVGTTRWEAEFASAVVAAGRAIGTTDDRIMYDLALQSDMTVASFAPASQRPVWQRRIKFVAAAMAWYGVLSGYFLTSGTVEIQATVNPLAASTPTEADPSLEVVRVKVVGLDPSATAASATIDLPKSHEVPTAQTAPEAAFRPDGLPDDTGPAKKIVVDDQSEPTDDPASSVGFIAAANASEPPPDTAVATTLIENAPETSGVKSDVPSVDRATRVPVPDFGTAFQPDDALGYASAAPKIVVNDQTDPPANDSSPSPTNFVVATNTTEAPANAGEASAGNATLPMKPTAPPPEPFVDALNAEPLPPKSEPPAESDDSVFAAVVSPSFNCSRARTDTELAICGDSTLAAKDREMARIYREVRRSLAGSMRWLATSRQKDWLKERDACGGSTTCILGTYNLRIGELSAQLE